MECLRSCRLCGFTFVWSLVYAPVLAGAFEMDRVGNGNGALRYVNGFGVGVGKREKGGFLQRNRITWDTLGIGRR